MTRNWKLTLATTAVAMLLLPGCATKKFVRTEMANQAQKIQAVESGVEENQRRIKDVDGKVGEVDQKAQAAQNTGNQAMERGNQAFTSAEEAKRLARGKLIVEETLTNDLTQFQVNAAELPDEGVQALDALAKRILGMNKRVYVEIQGHTDSTGTDRWNAELGERRAEAVRQYLNSRGIPLFAMSVISYGESKPVADNSTREGRDQNRRVVIRVFE